MDYRRARVPGGTYFFTLVTAHRQPLLVKKIDRLREAFRLVKPPASRLHSRIQLASATGGLIPKNT